MLRWCLAACLALPVSVHAQTPPAQEPTPPPPAGAPTLQETVDVVAVTPLHGSGLPRLHVPANVHVIAASAGTSGATDVAAILTRGMAPLQASEAQGGTFQPDVLFRGFGASPLLGASEGLAVYLDGMRANEPFGDVVNWDALPPGALASINVMPGSNPLFGLNALGGAVSIRTRDGFGATPARLALSAGAFARYRADGEIGGTRRGWAAFLAGSWLDEDGWRDASPSTLRRLFGKGSWRGASTAAHLSAVLASNDLTGNGTAPDALLAQRRAAVFTVPDHTDHQLTAFTLRADRLASTTLRAESMAYLRQARLRTVNGDAADDVVQTDEPDHTQYDATLNRSDTRSRSAGATAQLVWTRPWGRRANHAVAGLGLDAATSDFGFGSELGWLSRSREARGAGVWDDEAAVALDADTRTVSAFVSDTLDVATRLHVTVSARANHTSVRLRDRLGTALNGDHVFARINPAIGATWDATTSLNLYASYAQSSRVPTPVELTCADPDDPCRLPNAFVSDPPLDQPVAGTWEAGARGTFRKGAWTMSAFTTRVDDDLIFVSSGRVRGSGHFENVARTRRRGFDAGAEWRLGSVRLAGAYTFQQAIFGADFTVPSQFHPEAQDTELRVRAGDALPGVPVHVGRVALSARLWRGLDVAASWRAQSSQFLRGDEANLLEPAPGFSVLDARARWPVTRRLSIVAQVTNVLGSVHATFGMLGDASLLGASYDDEPRFLSPGAPRAAWAGVELHF